MCSFFSKVIYIIFQGFSTYNKHHNNVLCNRHKKLRIPNRLSILPTCYHVGGAHIKENLSIIEPNTVTGKDMILGMLQYIWPKVGFHAN